MAGFREVGGGRFDPFSNSKYFDDFFASLSKSKYKSTTLKSISKISSGAIINTSEYITEGIPLIRIQNIVTEGVIFDDVKHISEETFKKHKDAKIISGELLFGMSGTIGRVAIAQDNIPDCILNQRIAKIKISDFVAITEYVQALLNSPIGVFQFKKIGTGGIQINIGTPDIEKLKIPLPSLTKQREIATHISMIKQQAQLLRQEAIQTLQDTKEKIEKMILE